MLETRLLRRVIHYIWECFRDPSEMKIRLRNDSGDELQVEEAGEQWLVFVRYFAKQEAGEWVKQFEATCFVGQHGEWIPLELYQVSGEHKVYATVDAATREVTLRDRAGQAQAAGLCDAWALRLLSEGFLASAAKLNPVNRRAGRRPKWPEPTVPRSGPRTNRGMDVGRRRLRGHRCMLG